jgi:N-formylglutamate amidohydrolase
VDVNRPAKDAYESEQAKVCYDAYHQAVRDACQDVKRKWGRGLLVDLHGQGARSDAVFAGNGYGRSVSALQKRFGEAAIRGPASIAGQLQERGYTVIIPERGASKEDRRYTGGFIVQTYGSHRGTSIDAMQLELGTRLRSPDNLDRTAADLAEAIAKFATEYLPRRSQPAD